MNQIRSIADDNAKTTTLLVDRVVADVGYGPKAQDDKDSCNWVATGLATALPASLSIQANCGHYRASRTKHLHEASRPEKVRFGGPYSGVIADSEGSGRLFVDKNCQLREIVDRRAIVDGKRNVKFLRH